MKHRYRTILYVFDICLSLGFLIGTILLGIYVESKIPVVIMAFLTFFMFNAILAMWIVTSKIRTNETKLAWLLSFFLFPIISMLIYLIWGRSPYNLRTVTEYKETYKKYLNLYPNSDIDVTTTDENGTFESIANYTMNTRSSPISYDNKFEVIQDNQDFYKEVLNAIDLAKQNIFLQYYIIDDGFFLNTVVNKLVEKAKNGIKVYLMFDRYGCQMKFKPDMVAYLSQFENIQVSKFESDRDIKYRSANNFRNHRKVLIIDNDLAIYGGSNIADEYTSLKKDYPNWKDLNFKVKGNIVKTMLVDYCMDWDFCARLPYIYQLSDYKNCPSLTLKPILFIKYMLLPRKKHKLVKKAITNRQLTKPIINELIEMKYFEIQHKKTQNQQNKSLFVQTGPRYYNNVISESLLIAITNAKKSIKIISPYLQPNDTLFSALKSASYRNVRLDVILPGSCDDKWFLLDMNRIYYQSLLEANANIYEYAGFIHTKLIIIDDEIMITGTFNLDFRSLTSNFESLLIVQDKDCLSQILTYWDSCFKNAKEFNKFNLFETTTMKSSIVKSCLQIIQPLL